MFFADAIYGEGEGGCKLCVNRKVLRAQDALEGGGLVVTRAAIGATKCTGIVLVIENNRRGWRCVFIYMSCTVNGQCARIAIRGCILR